MKVSTLVGAALAAAAGVLVLAGAATADPATRTTFTGTDTYIRESAPAAMWFAGERVHIRGLTSDYSTTTTDPRVSGIDTVSLSGNFAFAPPPVGLTGQLWGPFHIENADGYWDGTSTGIRDENGFVFVRAVGHGGGGYEGLKLTMTVTRLTPDPQGSMTLAGEILDPGGGDQG